MDTLAKLKRVVDEQFRELEAAYPKEAKLGGEVLLGKHYADSPGGVLMLGLNPGVSPGQAPSIMCHTHDTNLLLTGYKNVKIRYWVNAQRLFCANEELRSAMDMATYSFCSPFRTHDWVGLDADFRSTLVGLSRPILRKIMTDCEPSHVIVAGKAARDTFVEILGDELHLDVVLGKGGDGKGTYDWAARRSTYRSREFTLVRIPHLSRAGSRERLTQCAEWLTGVICNKT